MRRHLLAFYRVAKQRDNAALKGPQQVTLYHLTGFEVSTVSYDRVVTDQVYSRSIYGSSAKRAGHKL